jgi:hypothetical protein
VNFVCKIDCDYCEILISDAQLRKMVDNELEELDLEQKQKDRNTYKSIHSLIDSEPTSLDREWKQQKVMQIMLDKLPIDFTV